MCRIRSSTHREGEWPIWPRLLTFKDYLIIIIFRRSFKTIRIEIINNELVYSKKFHLKYYIWKHISCFAAITCFAWVSVLQNQAINLTAVKSSNSLMCMTSNFIWNLVTFKQKVYTFRTADSKYKVTLLLSE